MRAEFRTISSTLKRRISPRSVAWFGIIITLLFFSLAYFYSWRDYRKQFAVDVFKRAEDIIEVLHDRLQDLDGVARFVEGVGSVGEIDPITFRNYVQPILSNAGVQSLAWVPVVTSAQRREVERTSGFLLTERAPNGSLIPAATRAVHYPLSFVESNTANRQFRGYDLGRDPDLNVLLRSEQVAGDTRVATGGRLIRELCGKNGFILCMPVHDTAHQVKGFILEFCSLGDVVTEGLKPTARMAMNTSLLDLGGAPGGVMLYRYVVPREIAEQVTGVDDLVFPQLSCVRDFNFAGRLWQIACEGTRGYHSDTVSLAFLFILPMGLFITRLSYLYLREQLHTMDDIERQVALRTEQLARAKSEWERTFDSVPDLIMLLDLEHRIVRVNKPQAERLGVTPAELIGKKCCAVMHGNDDPIPCCPNHLLLLDGKEHCFESRLANIDGDFFISVSPFVNDVGVLVGSVHVARDITRLKQAEQELALTHKHMQTMLDNLPTLAWLKDARGQYLMVNNQFAEAVGRSREEVLGLTALDVWPPQSAAIYHERDGEVLREGISTRMEEWREGAWGGSWYDTFRSPITDVSGRVIGSTGVALDISGRKRSEDLILAQQHKLEEINSQLEERVREEIALGRAKDLVLISKEKLASIGQLAAGVAHEINNPLSYIWSNLSVFENHFGKMVTYMNIQEKFLADLLTEEQREELSGIAARLDVDYVRLDIPEIIAESIDGAERVTRIVRDLKSFSRVDSDEYEETDPLLCLESALGMLTYEFKSVATVERAYDLLPSIPCHPGELNQVFLQLLRNARQALNMPGVITVKSWFDDEFVAVVIADNGCGISEEIRGRIFDPFFTTLDIGSGTGLGLSICQDIVARHGGELLVESAVDCGTTITVKLSRKNDLRKVV